MNKVSFVENFKHVLAIAPATNAGALAGDYVSLKNALMAWVIVNITQGNAATIAITIEKATAVDATGTTAITNVVPIWADLDVAASDALVRATDAVSYTTDAGVKNKKVIFQVDPASLGAFDCICVKAGASNAANIVQADYVLQMAYGDESPPSVIVD